VYAIGIQSIYLLEIFVSDNLRLPWATKHPCNDTLNKAARTSSQVALEKRQNILKFKNIMPVTKKIGPIKAVFFWSKEWWSLTNRFYLPSRYCSQLTIYEHSLTLLRYCTVHFYVVLHFCDSVWSFWVEGNPKPGPGFPTSCVLVFFFLVFRALKEKYDEAINQRTDNTKSKRTNDDPQNTSQKTKYWATQTSLKSVRGDSSFCSYL